MRRCPDAQIWSHDCKASEFHQKPLLQSQRLVYLDFAFGCPVAWAAIEVLVTSNSHLKSANSDLDINRHEKTSDIKVQRIGLRASPGQCHIHRWTLLLMELYGSQRSRRSGVWWGAKICSASFDEHGILQKHDNLLSKWPCSSSRSPPVHLTSSTTLWNDHLFRL